MAILLRQRVQSVLLVPLFLLTAPAFAGGDIGLPEAAAKQPSRALNAAQLQEMNQRIALADTIAKNVAADAAQKDLAATWRMNLLSTLYKAPSAQLQNIADSATTLDQAYARLRVRAQTSGFVGLGGNSDSELVFNPLTPCRYIDTRNVGGPLTSSPRQYSDTYGGTQFGGDVGCVLPGDEPAIAANVTIVVSAGPAGYVTVRPAGSTDLTSFINWPAGGTPGLANAGIIAQAPTSGSSEYAFEAFASGTNTQFIVDIFGYFSAANVLPAISCTEVSSSATVAAGGGVTLPPGCPTGTTAVSAYCGSFAGSSVTLAGSGINLSGSAVCSWNNTGSSTVILQSSVCCKLQ